MLVVGKVKLEDLRTQFKIDWASPRILGYTSNHPLYPKVSLALRFYRIDGMKAFLANGFLQLGGMYVLTYYWGSQIIGTVMQAAPT